MPTISPHSEQISFSEPRPQMLSAMETTSVTAATTRWKGKPGWWACGTSSSCPMPTMPSCRPTMKTASPLMTGVITMRSRVRQSAIAISTRPAMIVMPKTSGMPPTCAARTDGAR
jgi:hypothetical protein